MRKFSRSYAFISNRQREQQFNAKLTGRYTLLETSYAGSYQIYDKSQLKYLPGYFSKEAGDRKLVELRAASPFALQTKPPVAQALPDVVEYSDDALIELAGGVASELERRSIQVELTPVMRRAIENHIIDELAEADRFCFSMQ